MINSCEVVRLNNRSFDSLRALSCPPPTQLTMYTVIAKYPYNPDPENAADDLVLKVGDVVTVTEEVDNEWFFGQCGERTGYFPRNFVGRYEDEDKQLKSEETIEKPKNNTDLEEVVLGSLESDNASLTIQDSKDEPSEVIPSDSNAKTEPTLDVNEEEEAIAKDTDFISKRQTYIPTSESAPPMPDSIPPPDSYTVAKSFGGVEHKSSYVPPSLGSRSTASRPEQKKPDVISGETQTEEADPPRLTLKERMALLQKQQEEEKEKLEAAMKRKEEKKKTKRPQSISVPETSDIDSSILLANEDAEESEYVHVDADKLSLMPEDKDSEILSDNTKDTGENLNTTGEQGEDKNESSNDSETDEEDEEELRKRKLAERMAKLSGGMGMMGMMGMGMMNIPLGGNVGKKSKKKEIEQEPEEVRNLPKAIPILPFNSTLPPVLSKGSEKATEDIQFENNGSQQQREDDHSSVQLDNDQILTADENEEKDKSEEETHFVDIIDDSEIESNKAKEETDPLDGSADVPLEKKSTHPFKKLAETGNNKFNNTEQTYDESSDTATENNKETFQEFAPPPIPGTMLKVKLDLPETLETADVTEKIFSSLPIPPIPVPASGIPASSISSSPPEVPPVPVPSSGIPVSSIEISPPEVPPIPPSGTGRFSTHNHPPPPPPPPSNVPPTPSEAPPPPLPSFGPPPSVNTTSYLGMSELSPQATNISSNTLLHHNEKNFGSAVDAWWLDELLPSAIPSNSVSYTVSVNTIPKKGGLETIYMVYYIIDIHLTTRIIELAYNTGTPTELLFIKETKKKHKLSFETLALQYQKYATKLLYQANQLLGRSLTNSLMSTIFSALPEGIVPPIGDKTFGACIYKNNALQFKHDIKALASPLPGDIIVLVDCLFETGRAGFDSPKVGVVSNWSDVGLIQVIEENNGTAVAGIYDISKLEEGKIRIFRVVDESVVGW